MLGVWLEALPHTQGYPSKSTPVKLGVELVTKAIVAPATGAPLPLIAREER